MKNVGNPGGPLPDYMLKEQADLDRWRQIALRDPTGYQSSGVPGSGLTIPFWTLPDLLKVIAEAVAEETERCAEVCKRIQRDRSGILHSRGKTDLGDQAFDTAMACIDAIRQTESPPKEPPK